MTLEHIYKGKKRDHRLSLFRYNPVKLLELKPVSNGPRNWRQYLNNILSADLPDNEKIVVSNPDYLEKVTKIIQGS